MNRPPRKPIRTMRRGAVIALCAVCTAALALTLVLFKRPAATMLPEITDSSALLFSRALDDLYSVTVENEGGRVTCLYKDGTLTIDGAPDTALHESRVQDLLACCQRIMALDTVLNTDETSVHLHDFGLEAPSMITAAFRDGTSVTLSVGARTPASIPSHYAMISGDPSIYTVDPYFYEAAEITGESLRAFEQLSLKADLIDAVTIEGEAPLDAHFNGEFWQMTAPYDYPMDPTRTEVLLSNIANMRFSAYLGRADALSLGNYGLDAPQTVVTVQQAKSRVFATDESGRTVTVEIPVTTHVIAIGGMRDDTMFYALYDGGVYTTGIMTTSFLTSYHVENLLNRNPVSFPETALCALTLEKGGETTRYAISLVESVLPNNELETDEYGNTLYRFFVTRDGQPIDSDIFLEWYAKLVAMQAQGWAKESVYQGKPAAMTLTIKTNAHQRTIDFFPYDSTHSACRVNGVALFYFDGDPDALYAERP